MQRFFTFFKKHGREIIIEDPRVVHQLTHVLRVKIGEQIVLLDNTGREHMIKLNEIKKSRLTGQLVSDHPGLPEQPVSLTVYLAMIKKERFEWALEKLTELGVTRVVPIITERTVIKKKDIPERWQTIIRESAEQCERTKLMELEEILEFGEALEKASGEIKYIGTERASVIPGFPPEVDRPLAEARDPVPFVLDTCKQAEMDPRLRGDDGLGSSRSIDYTADLFIGPEGGWTEREQKSALDHGILPVHLANTILRSETAAITLASLALFGRLDHL